MKAKLILLFIFSATYVVAQITQVGRCEIIPKDEKSVYKIVGLDSLGLMIYSYQPGEKFDNIELIQLDTMFNESWRGYVPIEKKSEVLLSYVGQKSFYLLIRKVNSSIEYLVIDFKIETRKYITYPIISSVPFIPTEFKCSKNASLIAGTYDEQAVVVHYSFEHQKTKILPGFVHGPSALCDIKLSGDGSTQIILKDINKSNLIFINHSPDGEIKKVSYLEPRDGQHLIVGKSAKNSNNKQLIAGLYGNGTEYARGIFTCLVKESEPSGLQFYEFSELPNFLHHMKPNRKKRINGRIERHQSNQKVTKITDQFSIQEFIASGNQFLLIGAAFKPHNVITPLSAQKKSTILEKSESWYDFPYAFISRFTDQGRIDWDESFKVSDVASFELNDFMKVLPGENKTGIFYLVQDQLHFEEIMNGSLDNPGNKFTLTNLKYSPDQNDNEKPPPFLTYGTSTTEDNFIDYLLEKESTSSFLDYWYGRYLVASGWQLKKMGEGRRNQPLQKVFSINKIRYR